MVRQQRANRFTDGRTNNTINNTINSCMLYTRLFSQSPNCISGKMRKQNLNKSKPNWGSAMICRT